METEKSHDAMCKLKTQEIQWYSSSQSKSLGPRGADGLILFPRAGEAEVSVCAARKRRDEISVPQPSLLFRLSSDCVVPTHSRRVICFTQSIDLMLISSRNTLADTLRVMFI